MSTEKPFNDMTEKELLVYIANSLDTLKQEVKNEESRLQKSISEVLTNISTNLPGIIKKKLNEE